MVKNKSKSIAKEVLSLFKESKSKIAVLFILIVISQVASIVVPFISKDLIDALTAYIKDGGMLPWNTVFFVAVGILVTTVISSASRSSYDYNLFKLVTSIEDQFRTKAFKKYLELHILYHHSSSSGQMIGRIERGSSSIYNVISDLVGQNLVPSMVIFIGSFTALLYQNVWIAIAVLIPFPVYIIATRSLANRIYEIEEKFNESFEMVSKQAYDVAGNVLTVKKFSQEETEALNTINLLKDARDVEYGAERLWGIIDNIQTIISTIGRVAILALSAWFVLRGTATIGQFVLFVTLQNMAYQPLSNLATIFIRMRRNSTRLARVFSLMNEEVHVVDKKGAVELPNLKEKIEFNNVSFSYHNDGRLALKNINLTIEAGSTLALVGRSGSGKTTFINMLLRSYDPQKGEILFDGIDIRKVKQESLRKQIAVVPQEVDLFSRTVAENIGYGQINVTQKQIKNAAKTALAHDFIVKLENGYDTVVGERGIKLSGGERQRVGIARAVLRDPRLLILDEATSHLDTESERLITTATNALVKDRTSVIIAHRLSTVLHADKIVVFKGGEVEATGTHAELLNSSETYAKLHSLQFVEEDIDK